MIAPEALEDGVGGAQDAVDDVQVTRGELGHHVPQQVLPLLCKSID